MGASCAVWANALAAIKKATRNAKDSARIVSLATNLAPTTSETKAIGQIKGAVSRSPSLGPDFDLAATHLHRLALPAPALALFDPIASLRVRAP